MLRATIPLTLACLLTALPTLAAETTGPKAQPAAAQTAETQAAERRGAGANVALTERHAQFLANHCAKCHTAEKAEGRFRTDDLPLTFETLETAERWQKVLNALNAGEMPPDDAPQPASEAKADFLDDLARSLVAARKHLNSQRGASTLRRLNRREYRNTIKALLGVELNVTELPSDVGSGGFDTVGANLFMSSDQIEQYLALGREALDEAFARRAAGQAAQLKPLKLHWEGEESLPIIQEFVRQEFDAHERGVKWVAAVSAAMERPENATIVAELRKTAKDEAILRRSWDKIAGAPSPESFGFNTGENNADKANRAAGLVFSHPYYRYYLGLPHLDRGAYLTIGQQDRVNSWLTLLAPFNWPVGEYVLRVRAAAVDDAPESRRFLEFGVNPRHGQTLHTYQITGTLSEPQLIEIPLVLTGRHTDRADRTLFIREKGTADHIDQTRRRVNTAMKENGYGPPVALWVDWMELEYRPDRNLAPGMAAIEPTLESTLESTPGAPANRRTSVEPEQVRAAIERFAREAFRGVPPAASYLENLTDYYEARRRAGAEHADALKETLAVVLASPTFLYRAEPAADAPETGKPGTSKPETSTSETDAPRRLNDRELANRLSYFLWGAPPDAELLELARRGELSNPATLAAQTERLLDDPRVSEFVSPFVEQWLGLERLDFFEVNRSLYPRFDASVKLAARREVDETFAWLLRRNAPLSRLLKSDTVVVNAVLADFYGLPSVNGDDFRPLAVPADSPRGGLLGMAAVSVMGGNGERTSPVERGAWVLRKLLNDPPPPAPANVPAITRLAAQSLTTRERLKLHQDAPQCASCHRQIDPIGLGLENFDAVGQWRSQDEYQPTDAAGKPLPKSKKQTWSIDAAGALHRGPAFRDFFELREIVAARSDDFARGFSAALIEYALGRPVGFHDEPLIDAMTKRAQTHESATREFVRALVASDEFRSR